MLVLVKKKYKNNNINDFTQQPELLNSVDLSSKVENRLSRQQSHWAKPTFAKLHDVASRVTKTALFTFFIWRLRGLQIGMKKEIKKEM